MSIYFYFLLSLIHKTTLLTCLFHFLNRSIQNEFPECSGNESYCNNSNTYQPHSGSIPFNITAVVSAILTAVAMRLFCEVKQKKIINRTKFYSTNNSPTADMFKM